MTTNPEQSPQIEFGLIHAERGGADTYLSPDNPAFSRWIREASLQLIASGDQESAATNDQGNIIFYVQRPFALFFAGRSGGVLMPSIRCPHRVPYSEISKTYGAFLLDPNHNKKPPPHPENEQWLREVAIEASAIFGDLQFDIIARPYEDLNYDDIERLRMKNRAILEAQSLLPQDPGAIKNPPHTGPGHKSKIL